MCELSDFIAAFGSQYDRATLRVGGIRAAGRDEAIDLLCFPLERLSLQAIGLM